VASEHPIFDATVAIVCSGQVAPDRDAILLLHATLKEALSLESAPGIVPSAPKSKRKTIPGKDLNARNPRNK